MNDAMLRAALFYNGEGLCVIPVKPRDKMPALATWEEYQERTSTAGEIETWFTSACGYNIGIVHGEVSNGYAALDFDHDEGLFDATREKFPALFSGRLEQSGSQEGYHIPLRVADLPDFGYNQRQNRPKGNKTWKTSLGHLNARLQFCQTVAPPSIHPTGNRYKFIQRGEIVEVNCLTRMIEWLDELAPPPPPRAVAQQRDNGTRLASGRTLIEAVADAWPGAISVFRFFNLANNVRDEHDGELRLLGNGGLLIHADDRALWYNFSDEIGGDVFDAWGWCRFGSAYDRKAQFRNVLVEMAQASGIDVAQFYRRGDEQITKDVQSEGDRSYWSKKYPGRWEQLRG